MSTSRNSAVELIRHNTSIYHKLTAEATAASGTERLHLRRAQHDAFINLCTTRVDLCVLDIKLARLYLDAARQLGEFSNLGFVRFMIIKYGIYRSGGDNSSPRRTSDGEFDLRYALSNILAIPNANSIEYLKHLIGLTKNDNPSTIIFEGHQSIVIHDLRMLLRMYESITNHKNHIRQCKTVCSMLQAEC